jgi:hypothetical protein
MRRCGIKMLVEEKMGEGGRIKVPGGAVSPTVERVPTIPRDDNLVLGSNSSDCPDSLLVKVKNGFGGHVVRFIHQTKPVNLF